MIAFIALFGVAIGCSSAQGPVANANRDYELFVCAMEVVSTAPSYVLITVVDGRSGNVQQVAILSNDLRSALGTEYSLPDLDPWEANRIAIASHDRRFTFHRDSALTAVQPSYSPALLAEVRERLASLTNDQLVAAVEINVGPRGEIIENPVLSALYNAHEANHRSCSDAIAHVLLERQIPCGMGDFMGEVYINKARCPRVRR